MSLIEIVKAFLSDPRLFSWIVIRRPLRAYQLRPARAILDSVLRKRGRTFLVMMPRQSGKNETQAHLEAYLLNLFQSVPEAQIVKASPTFKPQTQNAMLRLETALRNDWNRGAWKKELGYTFRLGQARALFFSAEPTANVVGATASLLLECDEAQDVLPEKWDKDFTPMRASTNATTVLWGTAWTSRTLLGATRRALQQLERIDGVQRVFLVHPNDVIKEVPAYGDFLAGQIATLGRTHPLVKTQYFNEEIDAEGGLFPPARVALMKGSHPRQHQPRVGAKHSPSPIYAALLDVAGADEAVTEKRAGVGADYMSALPNPQRDATALTIVEVDTSTRADPALRAPSYRVVERRLWVGERHPALLTQIRALARAWRAQQLVVDATGLGAGLAMWLDKEFPGRVTQFVFTSVSKSQLAWDFLGVVDSGRFKDHADDGQNDTALFWRQVERCQYEVLPGPGHLMRWGVPDGERGPDGQLVHDDLLISAALCAVLDTLDWPSGPSAILQAPDPLQDMDKAGF